MDLRDEDETIQPDKILLKTMCRAGNMGNPDNFPDCCYILSGCHKRDAVESPGSRLAEK